jgi:hypothetical protein
MLLHLISAHGCLNKFATRFYIDISSMCYYSPTWVLSLNRVAFSVINPGKDAPSYFISLRDLI